MLFKKCLWFFVFLLTLNIVNASDINFDFYKEVYHPFETLQVEISTDNITLSNDLTTSNLLLRDVNNNSISIAKNLVKFNNTFYVYYFDLPNLVNGSYNLLLDNINYLKNGNLFISDFSSSFNVDSSSISSISVRPAYIFQNVNDNQEVSLTLVVKNNGNNLANVALSKEGDFFNLDKNSLVINPNNFKNVLVTSSLFGKNNSSFYGSIKLDYGSGNYNIPFIVLKPNSIVQVENNNSINFTNTSTVDLNLSNSLYFSHTSKKKLDKLVINLDLSESYSSGQILINNNASVDLNNLNVFVLGLHNMFEIKPTSVNVLLSNRSTSILISLNESFNFSSGNFTGNLFVNSSEHATGSLPLFLNVIGKKSVISPLNLSSNKTVVNITNRTLIIDDREKSNYTWLIIVFIIAFVAFIIVYFVYKGTKKKEDEFDKFVDRIRK